MQLVYVHNVCDGDEVNDYEEAMLVDAFYLDDNFNDDCDDDDRTQQAT